SHSGGRRGQGGTARREGTRAAGRDLDATGRSVQSRPGRALYSERPHFPVFGYSAPPVGRRYHDREPSNSKTNCPCSSIAYRVRFSAGADGWFETISGPCTSYVRFMTCRLPDSVIV